MVTPNRVDVPVYPVLPNRVDVPVMIHVTSVPRTRTDHKGNGVRRTNGNSQSEGVNEKMQDVGTVIRKLSELSGKDLHRILEPGRNFPFLMTKEREGDGAGHWKTKVSETSVIEIWVPQVTLSFRFPRTSEPQEVGNCGF